MIPSENLDRQFDASPPSEQRGLIHNEIRVNTKALALYFNDVVPDGREKSLAMTHLETAMMWANKGLANADRPV